MGRLLRRRFFVIYEGEGHAIRKPEHQLDQRRRTVEWFGKYLKP